MWTTLPLFNVYFWDRSHFRFDFALMNSIVRLECSYGKKLFKASRDHFACVLHLKENANVQKWLRDVFENNVCDPTWDHAVTVSLMSFWVLAGSSDSSFASTRFISSNSLLPEHLIGLSGSGWHSPKVLSHNFLSTLLYHHWNLSFLGVINWS